MTATQKKALAALLIFALLIALAMSACGYELTCTACIECTDPTTGAVTITDCAENSRFCPGPVPAHCECVVVCTEITRTR